MTQNKPKKRKAGYERNEETGCWLWTGTIDKAGYGVIWASGRFQKAHRYIWEKEVGPIPPGRVLDHICFVTNCVNPKHLRAVTQKQNSEHHQRLNKNNTSGVRNVTGVPGKWSVAIRHNRKAIYFGLYPTIEEAAAVAEAAREQYFTHAD